MPDNKAETIAATLKEVIESRCYERTAARAALQSYGTAAVSDSLDGLIQQVTNNTEQRSEARDQRSA
jgi:hypothetical protein